MKGTDEKMNYRWKKTKVNYAVRLELERRLYDQQLGKADANAGLYFVCLLIGMQDAQPC